MTQASDAEVLRRMLAAVGYDDGAAGDDPAGVARALRRFQADHGLRPDGRPDDVTLGLLGRLAWLRPRAGPERTLRIAAPAANLRAGPGTEYPVAARARAGETLVSSRTFGDWHQVRRAGGGYAYVHRSLAEAAAPPDSPQAPPAAVAPAIDWFTAGRTSELTRDYPAEMLPIAFAWIAPVAARNLSPVLAEQSAYAVTPLPRPTMVAMARETGRIRWTFEIANATRATSPTFVSRAICVAGDRLSAVVDDGTHGRLRWQIDRSSDLPALGVLETQALYVAFDDPGAPGGHRLHAVDPDTGAVLWSGPPTARQPMARARHIYLAVGGTLASVEDRERFAAVRWERDVVGADGGELGAPVFWRGRVYVASDRGRVYALDPESGNTLWTRQVSEPPARLDGPLAVGSGIVCAVASDLAVHAVDAADGTPRWTYRIPMRRPADEEFISPGAIVAEDSVLVPAGLSREEAAAGRPGVFLEVLGLWDGRRLQRMDTYPAPAPDFYLGAWPIAARGVAIVPGATRLYAWRHAPP